MCCGFNLSLIRETLLFLSIEVKLNYVKLGGLED